MMINVLRGFVKLKKSKNPRKTRIGQTPLIHPFILFFLLETCTTTKAYKKHKKHLISKKKK